MVSENEIYQAFDLYLKEENLELYDLNLVDFPDISKIEVYVYSSNIINLERSLKVGDEISGHFVYGHVDCVSEISRIEKLSLFSKTFLSNWLVR